MQSNTVQKYCQYLQYLEKSPLSLCDLLSSNYNCTFVLVVLDFALEPVTVAEALLTQWMILHFLSNLQATCPH